MTTSTPIHFNVYKVFFWQGESPPHVAIGVVPVGQKDQGFGRFYHVKGNPIEGMEYEFRDSHNYGQSRTFTRQEKQFTMSAAFIASFEHIARTTTPPYDPEAPVPLDPNVPTRDCATWVDEVLKGTREVIESGTPIA